MQIGNSPALATRRARVTIQDWVTILAGWIQNFMRPKTPSSKGLKPCGAELVLTRNSNDILGF